MAVKEKIIFIYLFCFVICLWPDSQLTEKDLEVQPDSWEWGIAEFSQSSVDSYGLTLLIQQYVFKTLRVLESHNLSKSEIEYLGEKFKNKQILSHKKKLSSLYKEKDQLLFSLEDIKEYKESYAKKEEEIKREQTILKQWESLPLKNLSFNTKIPILQKKEQLYLLPEFKGDKEGYFEENEIDFLIKGDVQKVGKDLFLYKIEGLSRGDKTPLFQFEQVLSSQKFDDWSKQIINPLQTIIMGRSWSALSIEVLPSEAIIQIDYETKGIGALSLRTLKPGFHTISIEQEGYQSLSKQIYLAPYGEKHLIYTLPPGEYQTFYYISKPPGARVYKDSLWLGNTPFSIESLRGESSLIRIEKDGYRPFSIREDQIKGDSLTVNLESDLFDREKAFYQAKKNYYSSLGWFSLSIALPLISSGIYQNLDNQYNAYAQDFNSTGSSESYDQAIKYQNQSNVAYYVFWGTCGISVGFLINNIVKLVKYLEAAEQVSAQ